VDTFAAGLVAFLLAVQWRWYINVGDGEGR
jgi:hypothetical protein